MTKADHKSGLMGERVCCVSLVYFDRYMLFFQMPLIPELLLMAFDLESMDQLAETIKNNKPTAEDVEAYKYNFSSKGINSAGYFFHAFWV